MKVESNSIQQAHLTSGDFLLVDNISGKTSRHLSQHLPQVFVYHASTTNNYTLFATMVSDYAYYSKDPTLWEEAFQALWGGHDICPHLPQFMVTLITRWEISVLSHEEAGRDAERFWSKLAFLLFLPVRATEGELAFGLVVVWVHPYQACLPSLERWWENSP